ncbi:MAG: hypothetical protein OEW27_12035 [Aquincola sp.]|nr:hypothetical protein [Aquincola sp.]MDH5330668.1 hypothetical protein [Aquincola sp.]
MDASASEMQVKAGMDAQVNVNRPPGTGTSVLETMTVVFAPGRRRLAEREAHELRCWVDRWLPTQPGATVLMGCADGTSREGRVSRLRNLRTLLARCGVPESQVRWTTDAIFEPEVPSSGAGVAMSACLKVLDPRDLGATVIPIRDHLIAGKGRRLSCSSAS